MVTMVAMTVGVVVFGHQNDLLTSFGWTVVGLVFSMVMYFTYTYTSFFGGIILAIYTMSLWPLLAKRLVNFPASRVLPLAMFVVIFYAILSAWVVAYNFVPGGTLTRERSDVMLVMMVLCCGMASRNIYIKPEVKDQGERKVRSRLKDGGRKGSKVTFLGRVIRRLSTVNEEGEGEDEEKDERLELHKVMTKAVDDAEDVEAQKFHGRVLRGMLISQF